MWTALKILLAVSAVAVLSSSALAAAKWQGDMWNYYHFDGHGFEAGQVTDGSAFLAVRNGVRPVVLTEAAKIEAVALLDGKGALAGICYIQSSGGKLAAGHGYAPHPRMPVRISSGNKVLVTVETDDQGYFVAVLDAGRYVISSGAVKVEVTVEKDKTVLVPMRTGKRMVD
jgi:hypothetical protein